jgi:hypothetical protein
MVVLVRIPDSIETNQEEMPISDRTAYERMLIQVEKEKNLIDDNFLKRFKARIISTNKAALGYVFDKKQIQIDRLRRIKMDLCCEAYLYDSADETALDNIADINLGRAWKGFHTKSKYTEKHIVKEDKTGMIKKGVGFLRKKQPTEEEVEE